MRNNETGEFELIVGNKQLLSGFFIVVLLFAVAFAMGYVVEQNSPRSSKAVETAAAAPSSTVADNSRPAPAPAATGSVAPPQTESAPAASAAQEPAADKAPEPTTQPAREPDASGA